MPRLSLIRRLRGLRGDRAANVSVVFALSLIPMIGLVGLGVDYGVALSAKSKLDNAADAAAIAAVAAAKSYIANNANDPNLTADAISAGTDRAKRTFAIDAGSLAYTAVPTPSINLVRNGQTLSSQVQYQTASRNNFGQLFGQKSVGFAGSTAAAADIPSYLDFYLLIDVSGSMGLPSTSQGQSTLMNNNGGCQFACHFPGNTSGFNYATQNNIQLRSGAVNTAVCNLLTLAAQPLVPKQYRVGLYPFITLMGTLAGVTSDITSLQNTATCNSSPPMAFTNLLDTGTTQLYVNGDPTTGTGSGGTHFETSLASMKTTVRPYGDGSSAINSRPFVFLITDGMQNWQVYADWQNNAINYTGNPSQFPNYWPSGFSGSYPATMDPSLCSSLKSAGATISVLYIPYTYLTVTNQNPGETQAADNAIPTIPTALQSCASSGFFYTANTPADINNALAAMFNQAVQVAHLLK